MSTNFLSTKEVSEMLGVGTTSIKRWADEGELECVKTKGGHRRFTLRSVIRLRQTRSTGMETFPGNLPSLGQAELDNLGLGVIELDDAGFVLQYNRKESDFSGHSADRVIGRHFFSDVAPCTNNSVVRAPFEEAMREGVGDVTIPYTFTYRFEPINVNLRLYRHSATETNWLIVDHINKQSATPIHRNR